MTTPATEYKKFLPEGIPLADGVLGVAEDPGGEGPALRQLRGLPVHPEGHL
jgi:hypothetical protein